MTRQRKLWFAALLLACIHGVILFAGFVAPYGFADQFRAHPFAAPTRLHFIDSSGAFHLRPFVYVQPGLSNSFVNPEDALQTYPIRFLLTGKPYKFAGIFTARLHLFGVSEPARIFLLGTDEYGRDQFSRFLYGGQISLLSGLLGASVSVFVGLAIGAIAGFYGGWIDEALMRLAELFLACPWLYLLFAVRAALPFAPSRMASVYSSGWRSGSSWLGSSCSFDPWRRAQRQRTQFRSCLPRLWRL